MKRCDTYQNIVLPEGVKEGIVRRYRETSRKPAFRWRAALAAGASCAVIFCVGLGIAFTPYTGKVYSVPYGRQRAMAVTYDVSFVNLNLGNILHREVVSVSSVDSKLVWDGEVLQLYPDSELLHLTVELKNGKTVFLTVTLEEDSMRIVIDEIK